MEKLRSSAAAAAAMMPAGPSTVSGRGGSEEDGRSRGCSLGKCSFSGRNVKAAKASCGCKLFTAFVVNDCGWMANGEGSQLFCERLTRRHVSPLLTRSHTPLHLFAAFNNTANAWKRNSVAFFLKALRARLVERGTLSSVPKEASVSLYRPEFQFREGRVPSNEFRKQSSGSRILSRI